MRLIIIVFLKGIVASEGVVILEGSSWLSVMSGDALEKRHNLVEVWSQCLAGEDTKLGKNTRLQRT